MAVRIVLLIVLVGALFIFVQSNGLPVQLTFLGIQTPAIPLGIWILAAIGAGILTSLILNGLFHLTNRSGQQQAQSRFRRPSSRGSFQPNPNAPFEPSRSYQASSSSSRSRASDDDADWKNWEGYEDRSDRSQTGRDTAAAPPTQPQESIDDWESPASDDWDEFEDKPRPDPSNSSRRPTSPETGYEARPSEPTTASRSGSVYSYGYREPGNSGAGRVEPVKQARNPDEPGGNRPKSVVDAEYRVIVPPYQPIEPEPPVDAEDWFDEDDDLETDEERQRRTGF